LRPNLRPPNPNYGGNKACLNPDTIAQLAQASHLTATSGGFVRIL
jgi:hypothetical protein